MEDLKLFGDRIIGNLERVIVGKSRSIELIVIGLLCQGHVLIEDVPGVGKTVMARSLAKSLDCSFNRIQFTPDMLPSDVTGVSIFNQQKREFEFRPGPIMGQIVLVDEVNRATPKTQASLLEAMEEKQVTVDGLIHPLPRPFMVLATQNELREETKREGLSGISTRFIMKSLDNALSESGRCINPINVREALINMIKDQDLADDIRKVYLEFLQDTLHKEYLELLEKEITKAFVYSYQEQADALFQNYLDHAEAYVNKTRVKDRNTREELQPDEGFLKSVEEQIAIIGSAADGFRQEVIAYLWAASRRGERVAYKSYEPLKDNVAARHIFVNISRSSTSQALERT